MSLRRAMASIVLLTAAAVGLTSVEPAVAPALAAEPHCTSESSTQGQRITEVPWAQQRYAPDRLASLATGAGVTVAVIDSGVDAHHEQLKNQLAGGKDFLDSGAGRTDCVGHGTAVASIIAASSVEGIAFRGLAPDAKIMPIRVSERQETADGTTEGRNVKMSDFAASIDWARENHADVINMSVVLGEDDPAVRAAVERAVNANIVVVAAAGNQQDKPHPPTPYPAAYDGVLGVGAILKDGTRLPKSQVGSFVDVVAPGGDIIADTTGGGQVANWSGTSFAAPFVSATAALMRQYNPELSAQEIVRQIKATADPAPDGRDSPAYGAGVLDPYRALTETVTKEKPEKAEPLAAVSVDPKVAAAQRHQAETRRLALWMALGGAVIAALALLCAVVIPRGVRRNWRPAA